MTYVPPLQLNTNWDNFWYFDSEVKPEKCDEILEYCKRLESKQALVNYPQGEVVDKNLRDCQISGVEHTKDSNFIYELMDYYVRKANASCWKMNLYYFLDNLQFTHYTYKDAFYGWHTDWSIGDHLHRKLSVSLQLSDGDSYEGGDLEIVTASSEETRQKMRKRGTIIVFPSFLRHQVTPIKSGVRYSLVGWMAGPTLV